jgi:hypothetical protein
MDEVTYFNNRAQHYITLARRASSSRLKEAYKAVALDFSTKSMAADPNKHVDLIDDLHHS